MNSSKYSIFISILIGIGLGLLAVYFMFNHGSAPVKQVEVMPKIEEATAPAETKKIDQPADEAWLSPDGKKTIVMKAIKNPELTTTYSFSITNSATESGQLLYSKTVDSETTMSIPFNTWSPGNQYVYIQEHTATQTLSYVFRANGTLFGDGQAYLEVNNIFLSKKVAFQLREVTGWAAPTLLIINTDDTDLKTGPSYWLDVASKNQTLTRLSNTFP